MTEEKMSIGNEDTLDIEGIKIFSSMVFNSINVVAVQKEILSGYFKNYYRAIYFLLIDVIKSHRSKFYL